MTFAQARLLSKVNVLHIRRDSWPADKWFMLWRGTWFVFGSALLKPVRAADYISADLLATDWTTVPAALTSCPVTPTEPGGGGPPGPGFPGFPVPGPGAPPPSFPPPPGGGPTPSPGPTGPPSLPAPEPGTSISVTFSGLFILSNPGGPTGLDGLNDTFPVGSGGAGSWTTTIQKGTEADGTPIEWRINILRAIGVTPTRYAIQLTAITPFNPSPGGFQSLSTVEKGQLADNDFNGADTDYYVQRGHAKVK